MSSGGRFHTSLLPSIPCGCQHQGPTKLYPWVSSASLLLQEVPSLTQLKDLSPHWYFQCFLSFMGLHHKGIMLYSSYPEPSPPWALVPICKLPCIFIRAPQELSSPPGRDNSAFAVIRAKASRLIFVLWPPLTFFNNLLANSGSTTLNIHILSFCLHLCHLLFSGYKLVPQLRQTFKPQSLPPLCF